MGRGIGTTATLGCTILLVAACASDAVVFSGEAGGSGGAGAGGGSASVTGGGGDAEGGEEPSPCQIDCSTISTPECQEAVCNPRTSNCEVVDSGSGTPCDDGSFCTADDACDGAGRCVAGPPNDCGMTPGVCQAVACDEASDAC